MPTTARRRTLRVYIHTYVLGLFACLLAVFHHMKLARTYMHNRDCYIQHTHTQHSSNSRPGVTKSAGAIAKPGKKHTTHAERGTIHTQDRTVHLVCSPAFFVLPPINACEIRPTTVACGVDGGTGRPTGTSVPTASRWGHGTQEPNPSILSSN